MPSMLVPLLVSALVCLSVSEAKVCETVQSAFTNGDITYLITDQQVLMIKNHEELTGNHVDIPVRVEGQTAAVAFPSDNHYTLISCIGNRSFRFDGEELDANPHSLSTGFPHVDAAVARGHEIYFFSGSSYQVYDNTNSKLSEVHKLSDLNLPNDVGAAWHDPFYDATMVIKGTDLYLSDDTDDEFQFFGPIPIDLYIEVPSLRLCD